MKDSSAPAYLVTVGFVSILGQVVILRELNVAFYGVELIYILALGFWMLGSAIGAAFGRRSGVPKEETVRAFFLVTAVAILVDVAFVRGLRKIFGGVPGGYLPIDRQFVGLVAATLILSFMSGILFRLAAKRFVSEGGTLPRAYALESVGGVFGGLLSTLFLALGFSNLFAALFCGVVTMAVTFFYQNRRTHLRLRHFSIALLAVLMASFVFTGGIDRWMTSWDHPDIIGTSDTPYGRVTVTGQNEQVSVFQNDVLSYETETTAAEEFVQMSALQATKLKNVLVLGGGFQGIISELLKLRVERIDYVEMNRGIIETVSLHLPRDLRAALRDRRVKIIYRDPRRFSGSSYNLILVAISEPNSAQNNRFYTREFFRECSMKLDPGGVMAFSLPSSENWWTPDLRKRNGSIYAALKSVFAHTVVVPGVTDIFIASDASLAKDPHVLVRRLLDRNIKGRLVTPQYVNYVYSNDRFGAAESLLSKETLVPNSDMRPACYGYTMSIWLSKFPGGIRLPEEGAVQVTGVVKSPVFWLGIIAVLVLALWKRLFDARLFVIVAAGGFAGMVAETVVILNYQNRSGALYQDIGILITAFMVGLALGAYIVSKFSGKTPTDRSAVRLRQAFFLLGLAIDNAAVYFMLKTGVLNSLWFNSLMLIITGAFVSGVFVAASSAKAEESRKIRTWLYSADLVGGCIGSLVVTLILVPAFGTLQASLSAAAVAVFALTLLK